MLRSVLPANFAPASVLVRLKKSWPTGWKLIWTTSNRCARRCIPRSIRFILIIRWTRPWSRRLPWRSSGFVVVQAKIFTTEDTEGHRGKSRERTTGETRVFYSVRHVTKFRYKPAVRESVMEVRMQPRSDDGQRCLSFSLDVRPVATIMQYRDFTGH